MLYPTTLPCPVDEPPAYGAVYARVESSTPVALETKGTRRTLPPARSQTVEGRGSQR
jgi:hypothetical protein